MLQRAALFQVSNAPAPAVSANLTSDFTRKRTARTERNKHRGPVFTVTKRCICFSRCAECVAVQAPFDVTFKPRRAREKGDRETREPREIKKGRDKKRGAREDGEARRMEKRK